MMTTQTAPVMPPPIFSKLLQHYLAFQIDGPVWEQLMRMMDDEEAQPEERMALAAFVSDASAELGAGALELPKLEEAQELFRTVRATS